MSYSKIESAHSSETELPDNFRASIYREAREAKGYSIEDLAVACGLTAAEITNIERGDDIDPQHLRRIAGSLGLPL